MNASRMSAARIGLAAAMVVIGDVAIASNTWAVVAGRQTNQGVADLLAASLSEIDGVQLVERDAIATVQGELKLNALGIVDPEQAPKFWRLAAAEAIVVVDQTKPRTMLRARAIETRTGVLLADELTFWTTSLSVSSSGDVAVGSRSSGVAIVSTDGVKRFTSEEGLPEASVEAVAWRHQQLYLAFPGAVGRLNIPSGRFELLASSLAVRRRSALDGGSSYQIQSLLADPDRDCVWLSIDDRNPDHRRSGIWRIADDGQTHQDFAGRSGYLSIMD